MKRKQPRWRLISGLLVAALIAVGILPTSAAAGANLAMALNKTVSASSQVPGYPAGNSIDGNQGSYWESNNSGRSTAGCTGTLTARKL